MYTLINIQVSLMTPKVPSLRISISTSSQAVILILQNHKYIGAKGAKNIGPDEPELIWHFGK